MHEPFDFAAVIVERRSFIVIFLFRWLVGVAHRFENVRAIVAELKAFRRFYGETVAEEQGADKAADADDRRHNEADDGDE